MMLYDNYEWLSDCPIFAEWMIVFLVLDKVVCEMYDGYQWKCGLQLWPWKLLQILWTRKQYWFFFMVTIFIFQSQLWMFEERIWNILLDRLRVHKICGKEVHFDTANETGYCNACRQFLGVTDILQDVSFKLVLETEIPSKF